MKLLGVCGSLQTNSSNAAVLRAVAGRLPSGVEWRRFESTGDLPAFNPDISEDDAPTAVRQWRAELAESDGVVISTPEYAHSLPGALKNALDWVVGSSEFVDMPVVVISAGPSGGGLAMAALVPVLEVISAEVVATIEIPAVRQKMDGARFIDSAVAQQVDAAISALVDRIAARTRA